MTTLTTEQKIAAAGYTMQEAREFITAVVDRPALIAQKAAEAGLNLADLAHIVNVGVGEVVNYFATAGVDVNAVNGQKTNLSLVSDLQSGDVYLYDPVNAIGRKAFSFGTQITDIATAFNGDVYATTFSGLYRYDFATKKVEFVASLPMGANSLDIHGTSLIEASSNDNVVRFLDEGVISTRPIHCPAARRAAMCWCRATSCTAPRATASCAPTCAPASPRARWARSAPNTMAWPRRPGAGSSAMRTMARSRPITP